MRGDLVATALAERGGRQAQNERCTFRVVASGTSPLMESLLRSHGFIHIPKTGGTSVETLLNASQAIIHRRHKAIAGASAWHLPPDVYEQLYHTEYMRPTFCVVREPRERLESCLRWPYSSTFHTPLDKLAAVYAVGRHKMRWTEEYVHRMPQSWYVWSDRGDVLCDCVVAYEKLDVRVRHNPGQKKRIENATARFPTRLYEMDALLYHVASASNALCYKPAPLWQKTTVRAAHM